MYINTKLIPFKYFVLFTGYTKSNDVSVENKKIGVLCATSRLTLGTFYSISISTYS